MKKISFISLSLLFILFSACSNGQSSTNLTPVDFKEKMAKLPDAPVIDVRTPGEYEAGHIQNAQNINWNDASFNTKIAGINKDKPVFVYCLSGGRSGSAASKMRSDGFKEVYELKGGMMAWRANNMPEAGDVAAVSEGMNLAEYEKLLDNNKLVLIDFYAEWCGPCKKMEPFFKEIKSSRSDKVEVIRIDADENKSLMKILNLQGLPVIYLYKNKTLVWSKTSYASIAEMESAISENLK